MTSRLIHSDLFEDDFVGSLSYFERLLWIGLFGAVADDQGRFLDNPALVRVKVFLYDANLTDDKVEQALVKLVSAGKIIRYSAGGKRLCQIANWWKYQKPRWAKPSRFPAPDGWIDRVRYQTDKGIVTENWDLDGGYIDGYTDGYTEGVYSPSVKGDKIKIKNKNKNKLNQLQLSREGEKIANSAENQTDQQPKTPQEEHPPGIDAELGEIYREYESNFGVLTPLIAEKLADIADHYPRDWIRSAFREAIAHEARNLKYVEAILKRWQSDGFNSKSRKERQNAKNTPKPAEKQYTPEELYEALYGEKP